MFADETLLLIGHGSRGYPDADRAMRGHAAAIRALGRFAGVETAVLADGRAVATAGPLRVVPFFMEDGYFTRVAVPRLLPPGAVLCPPVGEHDGMAGLIERSALAGCILLGVESRTAAVVVAGHGSASAPGRVLALHRHAARVAATEMFARVEPACLEEPPFIADVLASLRHHPVILVGYFAGEGTHVRDDVPALLAAEQAGRGDTGLPVGFAGSVADDPDMVEIVLAQAGRQGG